MKIGLLMLVVALGAPAVAADPIATFNAVIDACDELSYGECARQRNLDGGVNLELKPEDHPLADEFCDASLALDLRANSVNFERCPQS
jgi:hypothetical protein